MQRLQRLLHGEGPRDPAGGGRPAGQHAPQLQQVPPAARVEGAPGDGALSERRQDDGTPAPRVVQRGGERERSEAGSGQLDQAQGERTDGAEQELRAQVPGNHAGPRAGLDPDLGGAGVPPPQALVPLGGIHLVLAVEEPGGGESRASPAHDGHSAWPDPPSRAHPRGGRGGRLTRPHTCRASPDPSGGWPSRPASGGAAPRRRRGCPLRGRGRGGGGVNGCHSCRPCRRIGRKAEARFWHRGPRATPQGVGCASRAKAPAPHNHRQPPAPPTGQHLRTARTSGRGGIRR